MSMVSSVGLLRNQLNTNLPQSSMRKGSPNQTFDARYPGMIPSCCMPQGLPIYERMRDATITTAPRVEAAKSDCHCDKAEGYANETFIPSGGHKSSPVVGIPSQSRMDRTFDPNVAGQRYAEQTYRPTRPQYRPAGSASYRMDQTNVYPNRPLGFDHMRNPIGFEQYTQVVPPLGRTTVQSSFGNMTYDQPSTYPDLGPWRNFELPRRIPRVASYANRSYPRTNVPPPSRYYSTYEDHQPILHLPEVAMYRRRAPRFHSTPTDADFSNEGTNLSTVWGQDLDSMRQTHTSDFTDTYGWVEGVRMDSFNVLTEMTPSPKNVKVPPRLQRSYGPTTSAQRVNPAFQQTHHYHPNPYAHIEYLSKLPLGVDPTVPRTRALQRTATVPTKRGTSPRRKQAPGSSKQDETYCAPCGNTTFTASGHESGKGELNKTTTIAKRSQDKFHAFLENASQMRKDFCTVLEIRTPCEGSDDQPDRPLQLSINVTCADPSVLVTPDKRTQVVTNMSRPEMSARTAASRTLEDVPSDCACE